MATQVDIKKLKKLKNLVEQFSIDPPCNIPWIIKLLENPRSPFALPGKSTLYNHDCIHLLLGRYVTLRDEAFVIGFTMGNDPKTNCFHLLIYKGFSSFFYPKKYRFNRESLKSFDLGFFYGRKLSQKYPNLNRVDFSYYQNYSLEELRDNFAISLEDLKIINQFEQWLLS